MKWQIPYAGETYVFDDSRLPASEARLQKRITGGLSPTEAEQKRMELDPDAWLAALAIARRRAGVDVEAAIDIDLDELDLMTIFERTTEAAAAEAAARRKPSAGKTRSKAASPAQSDPAPAGEVPVTT